MSNYTRAEAIEDMKADLDSQIEDARAARDWYNVNSEKYEHWDRVIDTLLAKKDVITESEFVDEITDTASVVTVYQSQSPASVRFEITPERMALAVGNEDEGCGNDPVLVTELRGGL